MQNIEDATIAGWLGRGIGVLEGWRDALQLGGNAGKTLHTSNIMQRERSDW